MAEQSPDINDDAQEQQSCNIPTSRDSRYPDLVDTLNLFKNILDVKLEFIWLEVLRVLDLYCWVKEMPNIDRRCKTTLFSCFTRVLLNINRTDFVENVKAKILENWIM